MAYNDPKKYLHTLNSKHIKKEGILINIEKFGSEYLETFQL